MNVHLTDHLTCPRCGPDFGLILLAQTVIDRRVDTGELGCPNCRERYPVTSQFADLRAPPRSPLPPPEPGGGSTHGHDPLKLAAGLGVAEGPGYFVFIGDVARAAGAVAELVAGIEVVAVDPRSGAWPQAHGVSRMVAGPGLPFRGGARGVVLPLEEWGTWAAEAERVTAPGQRIMVTEWSESAPIQRESTDLTPVAQGDGFLVLARRRSALSGPENPVA